MTAIPDYSIVTELPGGRASREQISRLYHRYRTAGAYAWGKDVLEAGCGAGQGLGYLARRARRLIGGDYTDANLRHARRHYNGTARLVRFDAHRLPFPDARFDLVVLFEAISTVNCDWADFNPSPFSVRYFSAPELAASLRRLNFEAELYGAYPVANETARAKAVSALKRSAMTMGLMPRTMKGKEIFKRVFFGRLEPLAAEIEDGMAEYVPLEPISAEAPDSRHKILYAVGRAL
jgi:SAM-dependent methyltransferase